MNIAPDVARQYLKAMGIESWESRTAAAPVSQAAIPTLSASWSGAAQTDRTTFASNFAKATVAESTLSHAPILVVLEAPALESDSRSLLTSMLKAIDIDLAGQAVVNLQSAGSDTIQNVVTTVKPQMVLLMARFQNNLSDLADLRNGIHRVSWTSAPIALTLHPALLISQPDLKRPAWEDLKRVKAVLDG